MSEDVELTPEDHALLAALAALEPESGQPAPPAPAGGEGRAVGAEAETLQRLYLETLGLLPFALVPVRPRPELERRLMALVAATDGAPAPAAAPAPSEPAPPAGPALFPGPARAARVPGPRWPLALAAALILALLGVSGWLVRGLREQEAVLARMAGQRDAALRQAGEAEARLGRLTAQVGSLRDSLTVVASPAVEVCNLRGAAPEAGDAGGILFVAADHQHWTLSLRGMRPPGDGKVYQVWFVADQGMVSGGTFGAAPEGSHAGPMQLSSSHMPAGTRAVKITLEDSPGAGTPSGPDVLRSTDALHAL